MSNLPTTEKLADLVSDVTNSMFGKSFGLAHDVAEPAIVEDSSPAWRTMFLPLKGSQELLVAIASDEPSGKELCGAMFGCSLDEADGSMVDDALGELVNILAGQLKTCMGIDHKLGLPSTLQTAPAWVHRHFAEKGQSANWRTAWLRDKTGSEVKIWVAISECKTEES